MKALYSVLSTVAAAPFPLSMLAIEKAGFTRLFNTLLRLSPQAETVTDSLLPILARCKGLQAASARK